MADPRAGRPLVDYERAAGVYDAGRALPVDTLARWRDAVRSRLPAGPLRRAVDVGSGTGLFLPMWAELGAEEIVAVEPSDAMRARAAERAPAAVRCVPGTAEALPLAAGSADVAWLSAVIHHMPDLDAAVTELRRVVRPGGRVLFRGFFPDAGTLPWLDHIPGAERARGRFPTTARLATALARAGFTVHDIAAVSEAGGARACDAADWVARMRHADSLLTALRDDEVASGIAALRALGEVKLAPLELTLVTAG